MTGLTSLSFRTTFLSSIGAVVGKIFEDHFIKHFKENRLTENQLESLNAFLEIERNNLINRVSITINQKLLTNKDFIDTFLQVFLLAVIFASSKNYQFLIDNRDYKYFLGKYLLAILIKGYDQSRITKFQNEINIGFKIDLSAFDYESVEQSNRTKNFDEKPDVNNEINKATSFLIQY
ncbi:hypothetical protein F8M41_011248 [Gigaspora margarita]|uniref:Uncharacterized protein n=1 Tax=Gigaspora margarita TaxID=4874 RepID=A0A8H3X1A4_GIGMA|nr:hypothetical protein F8M41_011248 [Gigaspora margarita]